MRLLVASCRAYSDAWIPLLRLLDRFWPERAFPADLVTDGIHGGDCEFARWTERAGSWPERLLAVVSELDREPLLLLQEDFFPCAAWSDGAIRAASLEVRRLGLAAVRLHPCPGAPEDAAPVEIAGAVYGEVPRGTPYRVSCQATVWSPAFLEANLAAAVAAGERTPSGFEHAAAKADVPGRVLALKRSSTIQPAPYVCTAIVDGIWQRGALELCAREGIDVRGDRGRAEH